MFLFYTDNFLSQLPEEKQNALRQTFKYIAYKEWHVNKEKKTHQFVLTLTLHNVSHSHNTLLWSEVF